MSRARWDVSVWTEGEYVDSVHVAGSQDHAKKVGERMLALFRAKSDRPATLVVEPLRRGPLSDAALAWIASLSRHDLEDLARTADSLEDETLALAIVAEHGRRFAHDALETGEGRALDHFGVEVDEPSVGDEVRAGEQFTCQGCGAPVPASSPLCAKCGPRYDAACDAGEARS